MELADINMYANTQQQQQHQQYNDTDDSQTHQYTRAVRRKETYEVKEVESSTTTTSTLYKSLKVKLTGGQSSSSSTTNVRQIKHNNSLSHISSTNLSSITVPLSPCSVSHTSYISQADTQPPQSPSHTMMIQHTQSTSPVNNCNDNEPPSPTPSFNTLPALDRCRRYIITGSLHKSLFGMVKLGFDRITKHQVAIKISRRDLATHGRSISGAYVLENVRREAAVLRYLNEADSSSTVQPQHHRSSTPCSPNHMQVSKSSDADTQVQQPRSIELDNSSPASTSVVDGRRYICSVVDELEDEQYHYLVTDYMAAGDLYSLLSCLPNNRLSEYEARKAFKQICSAIKALHSRGVTHLDLSLENICLSPNGHCSLIDFGVAAIHPAVLNTVYGSSQAAANQLFSQYQLATGENNSNLTRFMCAGRAHGVCKPGKLGYMSPELWSGQAFDAYGCDVWSIGVILYTMTTGRAPFNRPDVSDVWFDKITTGQWLVDLHTGRHAQATSVYAHLSPQCLDLVSHILCPQHKRLTIDEILDHPWFTTQLK